MSDLGYDPIRDEATLQASLKKQREDVFSELERFMPEKQLLDVFRGAAEHFYDSQTAFRVFYSVRKH